MNSKVSIIIPAFNEERTISQLIERVLEEAKRWNSEIILVNDGSQDKTLEKVKPFLSRIKLVDLQKNSGKGKAIQEGLHVATGDIVIIQDADLEWNPVEYPAILNPLIEKKAEVVYGSRVLGKIKGRNLFFSSGGRFLTFLANLLYGLKITDQNTCYKALLRQTLESMKLECNGFEVCSEITAKLGKMGIKIYEVPIYQYRPRTRKEGKKISIKDGLVSAWILLKYKFK